jgi:hypothetical protein
MMKGFLRILSDLQSRLPTAVLLKPGLDERDQVKIDPPLTLKGETSPRFLARTVYGGVERKDSFSHVSPFVLSAMLLPPDRQRGAHGP